MNAIAVLDVVGPWIILALMIGGPVLLAWWLSDGFAGWYRTDGTALPLEYRALPKPSTHSVEMVAVNPFTGAPSHHPN